jgi:hypothetical protein
MSGTLATGSRQGNPVVTGMNDVINRQGYAGG